MQIVECVPNFSEGRETTIIERIADGIKKIKGVSLLDVDPGEATNRTVMTFVGPPEPVLQAAFSAIKIAAFSIDMAKHTGAHARQGATDVCPIVPVSGISMDECVALAKKLGARVSDELEIPVYLYEYAATIPERRSLQFVRQGEYEGLAEKLQKPEWKPDFGPIKFNPHCGATAIGARKFLIAYNVNLTTRDKKIAKAIAWRIRDTGGPVRGPGGKLLRNEDGELIVRPGMFENCKATGWYIDEYNCAQVTMNLTDWEVTPIHAVFDACNYLAHEYGIRVTGSELVGLVPREAFLAAGRHYLLREGKSPGVPADELIDVAIRVLSLSDLNEFDPKTKIVEEALRNPEALVERSLRGFIDMASAGTAVPGGGSVAATSATLSASLLAMVGNLSAVARGCEDKKDEMGKLAVRAQELKEDFLAAIDDDSAAYDGVVKAMRLPKRTDEQKAARHAAMQESIRRAAEVPLSVLEKTIELLELARHLVDTGMKSSLSDTGVAATQAGAAADGACYNVLINLQSLEDQEEAKHLRVRATDLCQRARRLADDVRSVVCGRL